MLRESNIIHAENLFGNRRYVRFDLQQKGHRVEGSSIVLFERERARRLRFFRLIEELQRRKKDTHDKTKSIIRY